MVGYLIDTTSIIDTRPPYKRDGRAYLCQRAPNLANHVGRGAFSPQRMAHRTTPPNRGTVPARGGDPACHPRNDRAQSMIYFVRTWFGEGVTVKIGYSGGRFENRLYALRWEYGSDLVPVRTIPGLRQHEAWLHNHFKRLRQHHEWFTFHPDMMEIIPPNLHGLDVVAPMPRWLRRLAGSAEAVSTPSRVITDINNTSNV